MAESELRPSGVLFKAEREGPIADPAGVVDELFAIQVRETRERLKMSQGELARQMSARGFPYYQQTVRRIEDSQRKVSVGEAKALAEILGTTIDRLTEPVSAEPVSAEETGYRGPTACAAAGITYRQLDHWARTGLVEPSVRGAHESGSQRLYGFRDILVLKVVKRLLDTGISLEQIRAAVHHLRDRSTSDLAEVTLMSDGVNVYECTSPDEVVDLIQGGQGVFGIALGRAWQEVEGNLAELPAVRAEDGLLTVGQAELSNRKWRATSPNSPPSAPKTAS
jgi:DNA-binding transcriptional MerR regulator